MDPFPKVASAEFTSFVRNSTYLIAFTIHIIIKIEGVRLIALAVNKLLVDIRSVDRAEEIRKPVA